MMTTEMLRQLVNRIPGQDWDVSARSNDSYSHVIGVTLRFDDSNGITWHGAGETEAEAVRACLYWLIAGLGLYAEKIRHPPPYWFETHPMVDAIT